MMNLPCCLLAVSLILRQTHLQRYSCLRIFTRLVNGYVNPSLVEKTQRRPATNWTAFEKLNSQLFGSQIEKWIPQTLPTDAPTSNHLRSSKKITYYSYNNNNSNNNNKKHKKNPLKPNLAVSSPLW